MVVPLRIDDLAGNVFVALHEKTLTLPLYSLEGSIRKEL
jgi:hypothetical protein